MLISEVGEVRMRDLCGVCYTLFEGELKLTTICKIVDCADDYEGSIELRTCTIVGASDRRAMAQPTPKARTVMSCTEALLQEYDGAWLN